MTRFALIAALAILTAPGAQAQKPPSGPRDGVDWVRQSGGTIPRGAVGAGRDSDGETLYLCIADHQGGLHPGKIRPAFGGCNFGFGGRELTARSYAVMVGRPGWARASGGQVPRNALQAGNESDGSPLFACRTAYRGGMQLGKVRPGFNGCNFSYGGGEFTNASYEVLTP